MPSDFFYGGLIFVASIVAISQAFGRGRLSRGIAQHVPEPLLRLLTGIGGVFGLVWAGGLLFGDGTLAVIGLVGFALVVLVRGLSEAAYWVQAQPPADEEAKPRRDRGRRG